MRNASYEFLKAIQETPSPSGFEQPVQRIVRKYMEPFADEVRTDVHGNVIVTLNPKKSPRVMLAGQCIAQLQIDRPIPDREQPIELIRDGDSAMLTGMEGMDWGGDFFGRPDSFIAVFREVVRAAGHDVSFAEVMGLSGAAFNLHMQKPWCPSSFVTGAGKVYEHAPEVFGLELELIELSEGKDAEGVARLREEGLFARQHD